MKWFVMVSLVLVAGCETTDVGTGDGDGNTTIIVTQCPDKESASILPDAGADSDDALGVVATCDDHKPCTVDIQCTPCSVVPEDIRFVKATCTPDEELSPFCFDAATNKLLYTGCTHFIADPTPPGVSNACFPVAASVGPEMELRAGICDIFGVCVDNVKQ